MPEPTVKIELDGTGVGSVKVDDLDVSSSTMRLQLDARPGHGADVVLHMLPGVMSAEVDAGSVRVDPDTHMALVALGWSPPDSNAVTTYLARLVLAATGSWDSAVGFDAQCAAAERAIEALKSLPVLTWHPVTADPVEPIEVPLNMHVAWCPEELGEFRVSSREVLPPAELMRADEPGAPYANATSRPECGNADPTHYCVRPAGHDGPGVDRDGRRFSHG